MRSEARGSMEAGTQTLWGEVGELGELHRPRAVVASVARAFRSTESGQFRNDFLARKIFEHCGE